MRQVFNLLSPVKLKALKEPGYFHDGGGLYLQVSPGGGRSWIIRYAMVGKRREMGLGPWPTVSLAAARQAATESRSLVKAGHDPIAARDAERARQRLEEARGITFDKAVELFLAGNESAWRNQKHRMEWRTSLRVYASPVIGTLPVGSIDTSHVTKVLDPIWRGEGGKPPPGYAGGSSASSIGLRCVAIRLLEKIRHAGADIWRGAPPLAARCGQ